MSKTFRMKRRVLFSETDMAGVLHFAAYYRLMEEVEHAFWRSVGQSVMTPDGERYIGWPRIWTSCRYAAPARFEDELELVLTVVRVADRSVSYKIGFYLEEKRIALGQATAVCCAIKDRSFEAMSIPPVLRQALAE